MPLMWVVTEQGVREDILREVALPVCRPALDVGGEAWQGWAQQSLFSVLVRPSDSLDHFLPSRQIAWPHCPRE